MNKLIIILLCAILAVANGHFKGEGGSKGGSTKGGFTKGGYTKGGYTKGGYTKGGASLKDKNANIYVEDDESEYVSRGDIPDYAIANEESIESDNSYYLEDNSKFVDHTDDYINSNKRQYEQLLQSYDVKLKNYRKYYSALVEGFNVQQTLVVQSVVGFQQKLQSLKYLNGLSNRCINKYRSYIPTIAVKKTAFKNCTVEVSTEIESLLWEALQVRSAFETHYKNDFNYELERCRQTSVKDPSKLSSCVQKVVSDTNKYMTTSQQDFEYRLEAAECKARAANKRATDCSYSVQSKTIVGIAEATVYINRCRKGKDECGKCPEHNCSHSVNIKSDYTATTIANPFLNIKNSRGCVMLNLIEKEL